VGCDRNIRQILNARWVVCRRPRVDARRSVELECTSRLRKAEKRQEVLRAGCSGGAAVQAPRPAWAVFWLRVSCLSGFFVRG